MGAVADDAVIQLRDVSKAFGSHQVLDGISFDIPRGSVTNIMGPSGTGKSVLLKNIIGLLRPERGSIHIDGEDVVRMSDRQLYKVRMKMGVLFQDGALFGSMDLYDNIAFPLREHTRRSERDIRDIVHEKAELVGLKDHLRKFPGEISGGMRKRGGLARALVLDPEIVLFDEPDSGLDPVRVAYLDELILATKAETSATFVVITHNVESTHRIADYMAILFRSRLAGFGPSEDLFASDDPVVRQFLHGATRGPIGMDELADAEAEIEAEVLEAMVDPDDASLGFNGYDEGVNAANAGVSRFELRPWVDSAYRPRSCRGSRGVTRGMIDVRRSFRTDAEDPGSACRRLCRLQSCEYAWRPFERLPGLNPTRRALRITPQGQGNGGAKVADVSDVDTDEVPDVTEDEEDLDVDADEEPEAEEASLDDLYEHEMVAEQAASAVEEDEEFIAKAMETAVEEPTETLTTKVRPRASGEFQCQECFLIKPAAQLADSSRTVCIDCV